MFKKVLSAVAACALLASNSTAARETIEVGITSDIASTEFATKHDDNTIMVLHHILEGLVGYRNDMTLAPILLEDWTVSNDGRTYRFRLREDVRFHNGEALTADILKWNFDRFLEPSRDWGSHCREQLDGGFEEYIRPAYILDTNVVDDLTVEVILQSPSATFLHHLASNHCIYGIVHPNSLKPDGSWNRPIATGPYEFVSWDKGKEIHLRRFNDYSAADGTRDGLAGERKALVADIKFRIVASEDEALAQLKRGKLDLVPNVDPAKVAQLEQNRATRAVVQTTPALLQLIPQTRTDPLLDDPRLRRAIAHAIDRERLVLETVGEFAKPNASVVATSSPFHRDVHKSGHRYDVAKAKELLAEAGYAGEPITILTSRSPYPVFGRVADGVAAMLRDAGINASVETVDWPTHDKRYGANQYQLTLIAFSTRTDPTLMYSAIIGQKGDHSWYLWEDQQAEMWNTISAVKSDPVVRQQMFDNLHQKMLEWTPTIGLANYPRVDAASSTLEGYEGWALGIPRLWGVSK